MIKFSANVAFLYQILKCFYSVFLRKSASIRCNTYFWIGDFWSRTFMEVECFHWTYPVYNVSMRWSMLLSDEYDLGVWLHSVDEEDEDED